jgi:HSP20 family protein
MEPQMNAVTFRPRHRSLDRVIDEMFTDFLVPTVSRRVAGEFSPRVNVKENDRELLFTFEVPGVAKDNIKVKIKDGVLTVSGERKIEFDEEKEQFVRRELVAGSFERSFTLPETVDVDKVRADYEHGLLHVSLARIEAAQPKEIEVSIG